jgi:hypothetical protein
MVYKNLELQGLKKFTFKTLKTLCCKLNIFVMIYCDVNFL